MSSKYKFFLAPSQNSEACTVGLINFIFFAELDQSNGEFTWDVTIHVFLISSRNTFSKILFRNVICYVLWTYVFHEFSQNSKSSTERFIKNVLAINCYTLSIKTWNKLHRRTKPTHIHAKLNASFCPEKLKDIQININLGVLSGSPFRLSTVRAQPDWWIVQQI